MIKDFLPGTIRVFSNITPILIFFIFAQILNIEELGMLNYIISLITVVGIFTDFGIPEAIQRFLPQTKNKAKLITYTLKLEFLVVFTGAIFFLILDLLSQNDFSKGYLFLLFFTILFSASNTIILIFNALDEKNTVSKYFGLTALTFLLMTMFFYFILGFEPILSFIYGRLISWLIYTLIPIFNLIKQGFLEKDIFSFKKQTSFNRFALNTFIYLGSIALITQWDSILITNIDGVHTNGIYKSVAFIATTPVVLVTILHTKLLPFFSKLNAKKRFSEITKELWKNIKHVSILLLFIYLISLLIYEQILNVFLMEEIVQEAGFLFPILVLAICIQILTTPFVATLQAIGRENIIAKVSILQVIVFLILSTYLYSTYSYTIFPYLMLSINTLVLLILGFFTYTNFKRYNITGI